jgi:hypothetical protein
MKISCLFPTRRNFTFRTNPQGHAQVAARNNLRRTNVKFKVWAVLMSCLVVLGGIVIAGFAGQVNPPTKLPRFRVKPTAGGYTLEHVSAKLMQKLPNGAKLQVTLDDPDRGKAKVIGVVTKLSGTSFRIKTSDKMDFVSVSEKTWLLIRGLGNTTTTGEPPCSGCPRDNTLDMDPDESSCWCYASAQGVGLSPSGDLQLLAARGSSPSGNAQASAGGCAASSAQR